MHLKNLIPFIILFSSLSFAESLTLDCKGDVYKQGFADRYSNPISFKIFIEDLKNCNSKREDCGLGWIKIHPKWSNDSPDNWTQYDYRLLIINDNNIRFTYRVGKITRTTLEININRLTGEALAVSFSQKINAKCGVDKVPERAF